MDCRSILNLFPPKRKLLQLLILLSLISWILLDVFIQYLADQLVQDSTNVFPGSPEYYHLKTCAINLLLLSSLFALLTHITGLIATLTDSFCLLSTYVCIHLVGSAFLGLLAWGDGAPLSVWSASALWSALVTVVAFLQLRDMQSARHWMEIERLSGDCKV